MTNDSEHGAFRGGEGAEGAEDFGVPAGRSVFGDSAEPATGPSTAQWDTSGTADSVVGGRGEPTLLEANPEEMEVWTDHASAPQWADEEQHLPPMEPEEPVGPGEQAESGEDFFGYDYESQFGMPGQPAAASGRDMPMAVLIGVILASAILVAMWVSPAAALIVTVVVLGLAAVELFNALRVADYQPAVLLGLASVVAMPAAVYWRGMSAAMAVLVITVVFGGLWYLTGVGPEGPLRGLAGTMLGVVYIGVFGSHAALMLAIPEHGTGLLTAAILFTVANDVVGMVVGRTAGRNPLSPASPNKTLEGLVGGGLATLAVGGAMGVLSMPAPVAAGPTGDIWTAVLMAAAAAVAAPIGDLTESLLKRDLGIKDMGTILPGHGGVLDRFDGLLFVLPVTYYTALLTGVV